MSEVEFSWLKKGNKKHKSWSNIVLGHLKIDKAKLLVDVNSEKRAKKFQSELKKRIKDGVRYKTTVIEPIDAALDKAQQKQKNPPQSSKDTLTILSAINLNPYFPYKVILLS